MASSQEIVKKQRFYLNNAHLPVYLRHRGGQARFYLAVAGTATAFSMAMYNVFSMAFMTNLDPNSPIHG